LCNIKEYVFISEIDDTITKKLTLTNVVYGDNRIFYRYVQRTNPLSKESFLCSLDEDLSKKTKELNSFLSKDKLEYSNGKYAISFFLSSDEKELFQLRKHMNGAFGNKDIAKGVIGQKLGYLNIADKHYKSAKKPRKEYKNTYHTNCWRNEDTTCDFFLKNFKKISELIEGEEKKDE